MKSTPIEKLAAC